VIPEQLGLGVQVAVDTAAIGADRRSVRGLCLVGPLARGSRFEATAVPELRVMAQTAAANVLETLAQDFPGEAGRAALLLYGDAGGGSQPYVRSAAGLPFGALKRIPLSAGASWALTL
jgi:hypothetical protein